MSELLTPVVNVPAKTQVKIAVIYDSAHGTTKRVAENVARGVESVEGASVDLFNTEEATERGVGIAEYDGLIWGSPTLFGSISAKLKNYLETTGQFYVGRSLDNKIAGGFTNSALPAGDKQGALFQLFTYATQHGMLWVPLGIVPVNNLKRDNAEAYNRGGHFMGLATQSFKDDRENSPPEADLKTARFYGQRVAKVALQFYR